MIVNPSSGGNQTIADGSITEAKLDAGLTTKVNAVGSVSEGYITSFHIATGSILGTDICGNTITYANIAHDAVTNTKIANGAVTHAKLSTDCVHSHNILDGTILGTDISGATITGSNIAIGTITSSNIAEGTILGTDISGATIGGINIMLDTIEGIHIQSGTITASNIFNGTITRLQIDNNTIRGQQIDEGTITSFNIANETILGTDISDNTIPYTKLEPNIQMLLSNVWTGIFQIKNSPFGNDANFSATFRYDDGGSYVNLFTDELVIFGSTKYIPYILPIRFARIEFELVLDTIIDSILLTLSPPANGILNQEIVGFDKVIFGISRGSQSFLEIEITTPLP
jgi:hypothetical protein